MSCAYNSQPFSWATYPRPILALAPMAGYTDSAFRQVVKSLAPGAVTYTEFASTDGLHYGSQRSLELIQFDPVEQPLIVQIFGKNPAHFAEVARMVADQGAAGIDINMGCPTRRADKCVYGAALLGNKPLALDIVRSLRKAVTLPLSVKTRLGHDRYDFEELKNFALALQDLGIDSLAIHGRTARQKFQGTADYTPLYQLKDMLAIPVLGSGDITSYEHFTARLGNLDGMLIGRAAIGNPWLLQSIENASPVDIAFPDKVPVILRHAELAARLKDRRGILQLRKHLMAYTRAMPNARDLRGRLSQVTTVKEIRDILEEGAVETPAGT